MTALPLLFLSLLLTACTSSDDDTGPGDTGGAVDLDDDGYATPQDCDDRDPTVHPDAPDVCNDKDDDCDGAVDEDPDVLWFPDADDDGFGDASADGTASCTPLSGSVSNGLDCDDTNSGVYPGAFDHCDGLDQDCDGSIDDDASVFVVAGAAAGGDGSADAPYSRIQDALDAGGQCIWVGPGTYRESVVLEGIPARIVSLEGSAVTDIDPACAGRSLTVMNTGDEWVHLEGLTLSGGCEKLGGGLYTYGSTISLQDVILSKNQASSAGAGIYAEASMVYLTGVSLEDNIAGEVGGGALVIASTLLASGVSFSRNEAGSVAGGLYLYNNATMEGTGLRFDANHAYAVAVAYMSGNSSVLLQQTDIRDNTADLAAGLYVDDRSRLTLVNAILDGNLASSYAGALDVYNATANVYNVTMTRNSGYAAIQVWQYGYLTMADTIVAANTGYGLYTDPNLYGFTVTYSDVWSNSFGNWGGRYTAAPHSSDISADPVFVSSGASDPWDDDLHLRSGSPCQNSGSTTSTDWDGSLMDMGAYGGPGGDW